MIATDCLPAFTATKDKLHRLLRHFRIGAEPPGQVAALRVLDFDHLGASAPGAIAAEWPG